MTLVAIVTESLFCCVKKYKKKSYLDFISDTHYTHRDAMNLNEERKCEPLCFKFFVQFPNSYSAFAQRNFPFGCVWRKTLLFRFFFYLFVCFIFRYLILVCVYSFFFFTLSFSLLSLSPFDVYSILMHRIKERALLQLYCVKTAATIWNVFRYVF